MRAVQQVWQEVYRILYPAGRSPLVSYFMRPAAIRRCRLCEQANALIKADRAAGQMQRQLA